MQRELRFSTRHAVEPFASFGRRYIRHQITAAHVKKYFRSRTNRHHDGANESDFTPSSVQEVARSRPFCNATSQTGGELPHDWTEVVSWARDEFRRCVSSDLPDARLHLAKACLLVALEEEAARSGEAAHPELGELLAVLAPQMRPRSAAVASTWSGERLEALAAEVAALLDRTLEESSAAGGRQQHHQKLETEQPPQQQQNGVAVPGVGEEAASGGERPTRERAADGEQGGTLLSPVRNDDDDSNMNAAGSSSADGGGPEPPEGGADRVGGVHVTDVDMDPHVNDNSNVTAAVAAEGSRDDGAPPLASSSFDFEAEQEQLLDRIHSSRPGAVCSRSSTAGSGSGDVGSVERIGGDGGGEGRSGGDDSDRYYGSAWPSGPRQYGKRQALYRRYPVQTLAAVNTVLFDRHGYRPCNRYGVPSDHQLAAVLEGGVGASAALSILYLEVCERLGFPLAARPLEDGRYFVLWPVDAPLTADGQRFLVDPYGRGGLLLLDEVCEIFGVEPCSLVPASRRELLAALLGELRDSHWAAAAGCSASPGTMTPLSLETALGNKVTVPGTGVRAAALKRALAAAEKRLWLLPGDSETQLQYGLLLYFSRHYDDAWIELSLYLERFAASTRCALGRPSERPGAVAGDSEAADGGSTATGDAEEGRGYGRTTAAADGLLRAGTLSEVGMVVTDQGAGQVGERGSEGDAGALRGVEPTAGSGVEDVVEMGLAASEEEVDNSVLGRREEEGERATDATEAVAWLFGDGVAEGLQEAAEGLVQRGGVAIGGTVGKPGAEGGGRAADGGMGTAVEAAASNSERSLVVQQVELLVERIRLVLDLAPAGLAS